jgi:hypothetical protein
MRLNLALNYSGREEILRACRALAAKGVPPEEITGERFAAELYTAGQPDPDLVIRTSGELRISNYLLWQSAYSEFSLPRGAVAGFHGRRTRQGHRGIPLQAQTLRPDRGTGGTGLIPPAGTPEPVNGP